MATPFKLKSGNASSFKNLGSSPAKQRVSDLPKDFNTIGSSTSTTPKYKPTLPKGFNTKGSSNTGKLAKSLVDAARALKVKTQNFRNEANKIKTVSSKTNKGSKVVNAKTQPNTKVGPSDRYGQKSPGGRAKFIAQSGGRKVGAPKGVATTITSTRPANTKTGPSDKYGQKTKAGREKFIKQSGGRKVTKGGGHYSSKKVLDATKKSKAIQLLKKGQKVAKNIIKHPITKKAVSIGKGLANIGLRNVNALFMMPAPMINPNTGELNKGYNKNQVL